MKPKTKRVLWIAPLAILGMAVFITVGGLIVRLLWNSLLPPLFGWHAITFWQALGLLVLCRILFGGLGVHGSGRSGIRSPARADPRSGWRRRRDPLPWRGARPATPRAWLWPRRPVARPRC